ncbi:MAG: hypothetical protein KJ607_06365 [Bacteroidetes bacterium]|nr:hypothetical protein [Bacteroidota bacterium]
MTGRITTYIFFCIVFQVLTYIRAEAQEDTLNFADVDKKSYELYNKKEWKQLCELCDEAVKKGIDYYYLRMRAGIAFYERKRYMPALKHFEKAKEFNSSDPVMLEYLYYSYLFSGMSFKAKMLAREFPDDLKNKLNIKPDRVFNFIYAGGGTSVNPDFEDLRTEDLSADSYNNNISLFRSSYFGDLLLSHCLGRKISVVHGYSHLRLNRLQRLEGPDVATRHIAHRITQNHYYLAATFHFKKRFRLTAAGNIFKLKEYTGVISPGQNRKGTPPSMNNLIHESTEYVASLSAERNFNRFAPGLSVTLSDLNQSKQKQAGVSLALFPLGNPDLYSYTRLVAHVDSKPGAKLIVIPHQALGIKLFKIWMELSYIKGDLVNYSSDNAFLIYNDDDAVIRTVGLAIIAPLRSKAELSVRYGNLLMEGTLEKFIPATGQITEPYRYTNHSFSLGLKILF